MSAAFLLSLRRRIMTGPELLSRCAEVLPRRNRFGMPCAPRLTRRIRPGPLPRASAIAEGDEVGGDSSGGGRSDSGRAYDGMAGSEADMGTMPSGVDCREPLRYEAVSAGLGRALGMLMAVVMRAKLGWGEGMRGRPWAWAWASWNSDMAVVVVGRGRDAGQYAFMVSEDAGWGAVRASGRHCE